MASADRSGSCEGIVAEESAGLGTMGLGRVKTPALAAHVETSRSNCISESQIILHTRGLMPCWRIVFSTFGGCMSFYTARVKTRNAQKEHMLSGCSRKMG